MKSPRRISTAITGIGTRLMAFGIGAKGAHGVGALSDAVDLGYAPENALPVAGQDGFPDSSGVDCAAALKAIVHPRVFSSSDAA